MEQYSQKPEQQPVPLYENSQVLDYANEDEHLHNYVDALKTIHERIADDPKSFDTPQHRSLAEIAEQEIKYALAQTGRRWEEEYPESPDESRP